MGRGRVSGLRHGVLGMAKLEAEGSSVWVIQVPGTI